jgi:hypothetical protein
VVRKESEGRAGKRDGQPAHTREAKLGCNAECIVTQSPSSEPLLARQFGLSCSA